MLSYKQATTICNLAWTRLTKVGCYDWLVQNLSTKNENNFKSTVSKIVISFSQRIENCLLLKLFFNLHRALLINPPPRRGGGCFLKNINPKKLW